MLTFPAILVHYNCAGFSVVFPQQAAQHQICTTCTKLVQRLYGWRDNTTSAHNQHRMPIQKPDKYPTKSRQKNEVVRIAESKVNQNAIENWGYEPAAKRGRSGDEARGSRDQQHKYSTKSARFKGGFYGKGIWLFVDYLPEV